MPWRRSPMKTPKMRDAVPGGSRSSRRAGGCKRALVDGKGSDLAVAVGSAPRDDAPLARLLGQPKRFHLLADLCLRPAKKARDLCDCRPCARSWSAWKTWAKLEEVP